MKYLFLTIAVALILASIGLYASFPDIATEVPVIYWVTDRNPAREKQVELFHEWLIDNEIGEQVTLSTPDDAEAFHRRQLGDPLLLAMRHKHPKGSMLWDKQLQAQVPDASALPITLLVPRMELRLDTGNRNISKQIIQSVSGVAGDAMDLLDQDLPFFVDMGVAADMTEEGKALGFDPNQTWEAIRPAITEGGKQYAFPCNVSAMMNWVNRQTFRDVGMEPPPFRWTFEQFEDYGKEFVRRANEGQERQTVFLISDLNLRVMHRSLGLSLFNETLTECLVDDPRFVEVLKLKYKWTYVDRILPTAADKSSFDTESGYGGATLQLFHSGNYGMFQSGRYALIKLRDFNAQEIAAGREPLDLAVVEPPHGGFPNTHILTRCAMVYIDGQPDLAKYFLAYLASEAYNMQIVRDADALPPNPKYTERPEFSLPPAYPHEAPIHTPFAEAARTIAIASVYSPFVTPSESNRYLRDAEDEVMTEQATAEEAAAKAADRINAIIARNVKANPALAEEYEQRIERQKKIDALRAEGKPVPAEWIDNVFYRRYYEAKGWLQ